MAEKTTILLIDDEEDFAYFVKLNLERTGRFSVETVSRGAEGARTARTIKPDLILLDLLMPDMDGTEVAEQLRESPATRDIPIVFLTALAQKAEVEASDGVIGGRNYIAKPVEPGELAQRIETLLGR
ncbi:MAG: response regulator [Alphaproteobacteria bacterium]|uniref:Response regulator n=1 Tax=Candidatus Nitrobium versatile TaxID=2884831 RepID=A0A953M275_9BACT|nr:response regulator [Candidatus Nitrobium versatile]